MNVIGLLRHGPTAWNRDKRMQGQRDIPLAPGFDPAPWRALLHRHGPWDEVVVSSLTRCRETCRMLFPGHHYRVEPRLMEQDWGEWTAMTLEEVDAFFPGRAMQEAGRGWDFSPPGGETRRAVLARVLAALEETVDGVDGKRILLITHLGVIKTLLNHLAASPFLPDNSFFVEKRALHLLGHDCGRFAILHANQGTT
jgi:broad specificity phosphatase PhoE